MSTRRHWRRIDGFIPLTWYCVCTRNRPTCSQTCDVENFITRLKCSVCNVANVLNKQKREPLNLFIVC